MALLTIVIVNWNSGDDLRACLASVVRSGGIALDDIEIVVVDNASSDGSARGLSVPGLRIRLIENPANAGFGAACNQGAALARSTYLLFLNPDSVLDVDTLATALGFMGRPENARVGVCGAQLRGRSGEPARSCSRFPTSLQFVAHSFGLSRFFQSLNHLMVDWDHRETRVVDHVIGAFYLIRGSLFRELGGFDERFFVYLEDLDLSLRVMRAGYLTVFLSTATAYHEGGGASHRIKATRLFYSLRSRLQYALKHFSLWGAGAVLISTLLVEPFTRVILAMAHANWSDVRSTARGYAMLIRALPAIWSSGRCAL